MHFKSYFDSSLHTTSEAGATATINFNGTGITLIGGNYGKYTFAIDGVIFVNGTANSASPLLNQVLAFTSGLQDGFHTAVLTNTGSQSSMDIDWLELQTRMGSPRYMTVVTDSSILGLVHSTILGNVTIDNNSPLVTYGPSASDWTLETNSSFIDNTTHISTTPGAFAQLTFIGDAVAIYGTVSHDRAEIQVSLDGIVSTTTGGLGGFVQQLHTDTVGWSRFIAWSCVSLNPFQYYRSHIGDYLQHNLTISAVLGDDTGYLDVDVFYVFNSTRRQLQQWDRTGHRANGRYPSSRSRSLRG